VQEIERALRAAETSIDTFFFDGFGGVLPDSYGEAFDALRTALAAYRPRSDRNHPSWSGDGPCAMLIDEVEAIWAAIDQRDDWTVFEAKIAAIRDMGAALSAG
jgi:hypothetical protein